MFVQWLGVSVFQVKIWLVPWGLIVFNVNCFLMGVSFGVE